MIRLILIALNEFGTQGIQGVTNNPRVLQYFSDIGQKWVKDDETAWCAAFMNWCLLKAGVQGTNSLLARSFLNYGINTNYPVLGDIVVLWRINRTSPYGHVGIFIKETENMIYILGGNQANSVNVTGFPKGQLLSYRRIRE
ncbi:MAG: TIGR02594 family protein [Patescibacteria group bacterium]